MSDQGFSNRMMERRSRSRSRGRRQESARRRSRSRSRSRSATRRRPPVDGRFSRRSRSHSPRERSRERNRSRRSASPASTSIIDSTSRARPRITRRPCWYAKEYDPIQVGSIDGTDTTPHDKALARAMKSRFDPSRDAQIRGDPYATLFVGRLSFTTTEDTLRERFGVYGRIQRVRLVRDVVTQESKGYAFIEYENERDFRDAHQNAHHAVIDGRTILVDYERSRVMPGWKPRRLGGGLGGKKESGQLRFGGRDHPFKPPR